MELNTGRTYVPIQELVTTTDGKCPDGYIEVETIMLAPALRDLLSRLKGQMASADAYALMLVTNLAKRFPAVDGWLPLPDLVGKLTQRVVLERELRALREANSRLRNVVLAMAKECEECDGTGCMSLATNRVVPCPECEHLRDVLEAC